jgi:hypothetical protein
MSDEPRAPVPEGEPDYVAEWADERDAAARARAERRRARRDARTSARRPRRTVRRGQGAGRVLGSRAGRDDEHASGLLASAWARGLLGAVLALALAT